VLWMRAVMAAGVASFVEEQGKQRRHLLVVHWMGWRDTPEPQL
jgi:hypothetical protein